MNMTSRVLFQDLHNGACGMMLSCQNPEWKEAWEQFRSAAGRLAELYAANELTPNEDEFMWPEDRPAP